jgi:hypothetical protein
VSITGIILLMMKNFLENEMAEDVVGVSSCEMSQGLFCSVG